MKILLTSLNSKYIHTNLAIRYLKAYCNDNDVFIKEYTINDELNHIISDIYSYHVDIVCFSCYIWNIEETTKVASTLKCANSNIKILLGGPEVSFDLNEFMSTHDFVDYVIFGEGEETFGEFVGSVKSGRNLYDIKGLAFRSGERIIINKDRELIKELDSIPFPYQNFDDIKGKIVYYESSRGCPYNCQYCLSSTIHGVRYLSLDRVKSDLDKFIEANVMQVKFVDRTFNCNKQRTMEIFKYIIDKNPTNINFHFEIAGDLLDDEIMELSKLARVGLFQFEIGIQSTNLETLDIINRKNDFTKIKQNVEKILNLRNIHIHLDLIAGLPNEGYQRFKESFNHVYGIYPHMLQLGFLKLLKGSGLRIDADKYGIVYRQYPPYEVIATNDITFDELLRLKDIEVILEKYYNSGKFKKSLQYIIQYYKDSPFDFYEEFAEYWWANDMFGLSHNNRSLYTIILKFIKEKLAVNLDLLKDLLKFDYLANENNANLPDGLDRTDTKAYTFEFLKNEENVNRYLPEYIGMTAKNIFKKVHIEKFQYNILSNLDNEETVILFSPHTQKILDLEPGNQS